jgi:beta-lactam-binding protein with PASTA domain
MWRSISSERDGHPNLPLGEPSDLSLATESADPAPVAAHPAGGVLTVPDLVGMSSQDARRIARLSDVRIDVEERASERESWGQVLSQEPESGVELVPGDIVTVVVGSRPHVKVPDVKGREEAEALVALREAGLIPERRIARQSNSMPEGYVMRTRPRAGSSIPSGTRVSYVVAVPPRPRGSQRRREARHGRVHRLPDGTFLTTSD